MQQPPTPAPPEDEDPLAFAPVPVSARHNGWSERRQHDFIAALAAMGSVTRAAKAVGMTKQSAYKLRERAGAEGFARAWDIALRMGYDEMFGRALDRALRGYEVPRFYRGRQIGTIHRFDHRLAMAALNSDPPHLRKKSAK
jgi:hypothetical protein